MTQSIITVLGAGSWGTALSTVLHSNGHETRLWMRNPEQAQSMEQHRVNDRYLPGIALPEGLIIETDLEKALKGADAVVLAVPTQEIRKLLEVSRSMIPSSSVVINAAKGIERHSYLRISEIVKEILGTEQSYVVISGPSHAEEVARRMPTTLVAASVSQAKAELVQNYLMNQTLRIYTNPDVAGVELAGALKNIIAFGAGIADGIGYGDNAKAALMTRGIAEIARLGKEMGASLNTFAGLAGIGDLMVTCTSQHSRNRRAGALIGQGKSLEEALNSVGMVVEGVFTAGAAYHLAQQYQVEMPITEAIYRVIDEGLDVRTAVVDLMTRQRKHEIEEIAALDLYQWRRPEGLDE